MIPGEYLLAEGEIELNEGLQTQSLSVANTGDRPIQVGSHYHFAETNPALEFDRASARGLRLDIGKGNAVLVFMDPLGWDLAAQDASEDRWVVLSHRACS